jgi:exosome complex component RRP43
VDETRGLNLKGLPVCCTWGVFEAGKAQVGEDASEVDGKEVKRLNKGGRAWFLADPDEFEDPLCRETVSITVDATGGKTRVLRVEKSGGSAIGMLKVRQLVDAATERWKEWNTAIGGGSQLR